MTVTRTKRKRQSVNEKNDNNLILKHIEPKTRNQELAFKYYEKNHLCLAGSPGTGKSFVALYLALNTLFNNNHYNTYKKVVIIRSTVPTRDMGFLPGNVKEKMKEYEAPYEDIVNDLFGRADAYSILKTKNFLEFRPSSFLRGCTLDNVILIIEEFQNMDFQELTTVLTRIGENTKVIITGDTKQDDLTSERFKVVSGGSKMLNILKNIDAIEIINFTHSDIVRSRFVKDLIIAIEDYEDNEAFNKYQNKKNLLLEVA